jgi:hypothetical protein
MPNDLKFSKSNAGRPEETSAQETCHVFPNLHYAFVPSSQGLLKVDFSTVKKSLFRPGNYIVMKPAWKCRKNGTEIPSKFRLVDNPFIGHLLAGIRLSRLLCEMSLNLSIVLVFDIGRCGDTESYDIRCCNDVNECWYFIEALDTGAERLTSTWQCPVGIMSTV